MQRGLTKLSSASDWTNPNGHLSNSIRGKDAESVFYRWTTIFK